MKGEINVLYADYSNYIILYECVPSKSGESHDFLWLFSRTPTLSTDMMKAATSKMEEYFDIEHLHTVNHDAVYCGKPKKV